MKRYIRNASLDEIPDENKNGDCFVIALNKAMEDPQRYTLVHGVVTGQGAIEGIEYTHAWVEDGDMVIDMTLPASMQRFPKVAYYAIGNIKITRKYNYRQMLENVCKYETYGPWDKVFEGYL
jgi:hypothetical protein